MQNPKRDEIWSSTSEPNIWSTITRQLVCFQVTAAAHTHVLLVTKHYNMVPVSGRWCSMAGKVTTGLAKSNGSLSPGGWLPVH